MEMTSLYKANFAAGQEYERFIADKWPFFFGHPLRIHEGRMAQLKGETEEGVEIKLDRMFHKTGNLYFETAEKSNPDNPQMVESGILRNDNTQWFLIGNKHEAFIFDILVLRRCEKNNHYWLIRRETSTSQGWTMPKIYIPQYAQFYLNFNDMYMKTY